MTRRTGGTRIIYSVKPQPTAIHWPRTSVARTRRSAFSTHSSTVSSRETRPELPPRSRNTPPYTLESQPEPSSLSPEPPSRTRGSRRVHPHIQSPRTITSLLRPRPKATVTDGPAVRPFSLPMSATHRLSFTKRFTRTFYQKVHQTLDRRHCMLLLHGVYVS
jgi:hypothetical protein